MVVERGVSNDGVNMIDSEECSMVNDFVYLGSTVSAECQLHQAVEATIRKVSRAFS